MLHAAVEHEQPFVDDASLSRLDKLIVHNLRLREVIASIALVDIDYLLHRCFMADEIHDELLTNREAGWFTSHGPSEN